MKKYKLLALTLVIGTSSLFAINLEKVDPKIESKPPVKKLISNSDISQQNGSSINSTLTYKSHGEIVVKSFDANLKSIQVEMKFNYKDSQNQAAREYSYVIRPDIISKE